MRDILLQLAKTNSKILYSFLFLILFDNFLHAQSLDTIFLKEAETIFTEIEQICNQDNGKLWGNNLYCPLIFAKRERRTAISNCKILFSNTIPYKGLNYGYLDDSIVISGSAYPINDTICAILPYELEDDYTIKLQAFLHEMFHVFQSNKGWKYVYNNSHLDNPHARVFLSCEIRALINTLSSDSTEKKRYLSEALFFRQQRNRIYPEKAIDEHLFEIHEGLADYTMYKLCLSSDEKINKCLIEKLESKLKSETYSRLYGYTVGAVYAFLNDVQPEWKHHIDTLSSLSMLTWKIYGIDYIKTDSAQIWADYGVDSLLIVEDSIFKIKLQLEKNVYQAINENKVLIIDYNNCHFGFNPSMVIGFNDDKNYYQIMEIRGNFGCLSTRYGCLLSDKIYVLLPPKIKLGCPKTYPEHFSIQLNKKWKIKNNLIVKSKNLEQ